MMKYETMEVDFFKKNRANDFILNDFYLFLPKTKAK